MSVRPSAKSAGEIVSNAAPIKINDIPIKNNTPLIKARKLLPCIIAPTNIVNTPRPISKGPTKHTGK